MKVSLKVLSPHKRVMQVNNIRQKPVATNTKVSEVIFEGL